MPLLFFKRHRDSEYTDEELLALYRESGDISHFNKLYERSIPLIYGLCLKYLRSPELSQDAVMDIYESLSGKIHNYDIKVFRTWLYSVVKNHCFLSLKNNAKEIPVEFNAQIMESDDLFPLLDDGEYDESKEQALGHCLDKLPEPQQLSVKKFYLEDKSYADIVSETGYNLKSVKSYIQNGKRNLKICIEKLLKE